MGVPTQNFQKIGKLYILYFHGAFKVFQNLDSSIWYRARRRPRGTAFVFGCLAQQDIQRRMPRGWRGRRANVTWWAEFSVMSVANLAL